MARLLDLQVLPLTFVVERAHRVPSTLSILGALARPLILKMLNYCDRILAVVRNKPDLHYEFSLLYPSRLWVVEGDRVHFFESPEVAVALLWVLSLVYA